MVVRKSERERPEGGAEEDRVGHLQDGFAQ
jgi:hypothetical protein